MSIFDALDGEGFISSSQRLLLCREKKKGLIINYITLYNTKHILYWLTT